MSVTDVRKPSRGRRSGGGRAMRGASSSARQSERVVVTGLGIVSPIGIGVHAFWKNALAGRSGVAALPAFEGLPLEAYRSQVAGQVLDFDPAQLPAGTNAD